MWTAAHIAASWGHASTLRLLLYHNADPFIIDCSHQQLNVWDVAQVYDHFLCIAVLEQALNGNAVTNALCDDSVTGPDSDDDYYSIIDLTSDDDSFTFVDAASRHVRVRNSSALSLKKHVDKKFGVALVELTMHANNVKKEHSSDVTYDKYDGNTVAKGPATAALDDSIANLDADTVRKRLIALGDSPGPITASTEKFYRNRLQRMTRASLCVLPSTKSLPLPSYSAEINRLIMGESNFDECRRLEAEFVALFEKQGPSAKNYFTYLLLDPRITKNLPAAVTSNDCAHFDGQLFKRFAEAIFYVGKGQGNRPFMHLYEAALCDNDVAQRKRPPNKKVKRVLEIWAEKLGVVSLHCFHTITSNEALARECLMIEALGLANLTNIQIGQNRSRELRWTEHKRQMLGTYFLYKAYNFTYLVNGERQIKRCDIAK